jgi:predicted amidophosphoribosyltransferase
MTIDEFIDACCEPDMAITEKSANAYQLRLEGKARCRKCGSELLYIGEERCQTCGLRHDGIVFFAGEQ